MQVVVETTAGSSLTSNSSLCLGQLSLSTKDSLLRDPNLLVLLLVQAEKAAPFRQDYPKTI